MKILLSVLSLMLAATVFAQKPASKAVKVQAKKSIVKTKAIPQIRAVQMQNVVSIIDSSTTPLIVNFWASWCAPCVEEIPYFESIVAEHAKDSIKLLLVSLDFKNDYQKVLLDSFVSKHKYKSQVVWLSENNADIICPMIDKKWDGNIPASLMVNNKTGYRMFYGNQLKEARFKLEVEALIK